MNVRPDEKCSWLALYLIEGLGNNVFRRLLEKFGSPESVFRAGVSDLLTVKGVREVLARRIVRKEFSCDPSKELRNVELCGGRIITYRDTQYPAPLKEIHSPPVVLYARGKDIPLNRDFISVVGSRNPTHYGLKAAERIGFGLASRGTGVVSGLARGIDAAAHKGCLMAHGFTIGVLGTGIDVVYPSTNRELFRQVLENGAIISEFPVGTPPEPRNFPIRNRIISGLSKGVAVVEATKNSGSLITASFALDQGREVFAVPGSIDSFKSTGTHFLIKQGAKLIENADDILDEFELFRSPEYCGGEISGDRPGVSQDMDEYERKIYDFIGDYPMHIDQIVREGDLKAGEVSSILMRLELKGLIRQLPGKMFIR